MNATTTPTYFDLGPTSSYARRRIGWFPKEDATGTAGTMRVICQPGKRPRDSDSVDDYLVQEERDLEGGSGGIPPANPPGPRGVRSFLLENTTEPDAGGPFRVVVGADDRGEVFDRCGCEAGKFRRACKHLAGISKLVSAGAL